jgi:hypothetical protein
MTWPPEPLAPRRPFHETQWRLVTPSKRTLVCDIVKIETGLEVRAFYEHDPENPIRTQLTPGLGSAYTLANQWKAGALAMGGFREY